MQYTSAHLRADIDKCWSLAYTEEWEKAKEFLDAGKVSLHELEQRAGKELLTFFSERNNMINAIEYLISERGKPSIASALAAVNAAVLGGKVGSVRFLLDAVCSINELETLEGELQPLHLAVARGNHGLIKLLVENGADINFFASKGHSEISNTPAGTPLMVASRSSPDDMINILVDLGADVNAKNPATGDTVLHVLVASDHYLDDHLLHLLKNEADYTLKNNEGKTPMEVACQKSFQTILNMAMSGKLQKRKNPYSSANTADEPPAKRAKVDKDQPIFHTLPDKDARLEFWTVSGASAKHPNRQAIAQDLIEISDSTSPLASAAKLARSIEEALTDILFMSQGDSPWMPFLVEVPASNANVSIMESIKTALGAAKSKPKQKTIKADAVYQFGQNEDADDEGEDEEDEEANEEREKAAKALELLRTGTQDLTEVRLPQSNDVSALIMLCGKFHVSNEIGAIVGVYATQIE